MNASATIGMFPRRRRVPWSEAGAACAAVAIGALAAVAPLQALALAAAGLLAVATFAFPVAMLTLVLVLTAIVPYGLQNAVGVGGGSASPGLLPSDLIILMGIARALLMLVQRPPDRRSALVVILTLAFLVATALQSVHGLILDRALSDVGAESRVLLGFGVLLMTLPILGDPGARNRLFRGLIFVGIALGLVGIAQWALQLDFGAAGDFGLRRGVRLTSEGKGQIQGGLFAFPAAVIIAFALLASGRLRSVPARIGVLAVMALNAASLLLTFERTFWVATVVALGLVYLRQGGLQRARLLVWTPISLLLIIAALASLAPAEFTTARQRLMSIGQYAQDDSLRERIVESREVLERISEQPILGSGFGATITWGRPWQDVPARTTAYSHNGYLWAAWKMGIPVALLLTAAILAASLWRDPLRNASVYGALRNGCQASLLALLIVSVTFPAYNSGSITAAMGMMLAICLAPYRSAIPRPGNAASSVARSPDQPAESYGPRSPG